MKPLKCSKLLALATPVALFLSSPSAFAGGAMSAPAEDVGPIARAAPAASRLPAETAHKLASFAAMLRTIVAVATTAPSRPMMDADGCPLPGNVGKGGGAHCSMRERPVTAAADEATGGSRR